MRNQSNLENQCWAFVEFTAFLLLLLPASGSLCAQSSTQFNITLARTIDSEPVTGRVLVFLSKDNLKPINGPAWFGTEPFFAKDVSNVKPGDTITIDESADGFPGKLSKLGPGEYNIQAILDHDFYSSNHAAGAGNFVSKTEKVQIKGQPIDLILQDTIPPNERKDTRHTKYVAIESKLLAAFHNREVIERALVVLPKSYESSPDRRYPVYYEITGFGGTLKQSQRRWSHGQSAPADDQAEFIRVTLTGQCKWGHHVYANSATNGPRGDALVQELIPEIDRRFRTIAEPSARFLGGHSSGGWSSLWLQVSYPDFFGGVWSTAPDPVDFRDWQGTNIYEPNANVYRDKDGMKRPLARFGDRVVAYYEDFTKMDDVLGRGGQIRSFDAVFSPRMDNGQPARCWNRKTGIVDPQILQHWKKYDISLKLEQNWSELEPKLTSKIHVIMGGRDTFYLEGATIKLKERLQQLGSDAAIEIVAGKDHSNLLSRQLRRQILTEMSAQFWRHHPK